MLTINDLSLYLFQHPNFTFETCYLDRKLLNIKYGVHDTNIYLVDEAIRNVHTF